MKHFNEALTNRGDTRSGKPTLFPGSAYDDHGESPPSIVTGGNGLPDCRPGRSSCPHRASYQTSCGWYSENPEGFYARKEQARIVVDAITKLPRRLRNVYLLRNVMDFSTKEVAAQSGISTNAVRLRLFRAHGQIRKSLGVMAVASRRKYRRTTQSGAANPRWQRNRKITSRNDAPPVILPN